MSADRKVGVWGATGIGAGAMLGAGVFAVWGPATELAGPLLIWAVAIAGAVALVNALSTAQLASYYSVAGGAYSFGRSETNDYVGFVAGIGFVLGKTASIAAIALAIGWYVWPAGGQWLAAAAILVGWALNARGVRRTALVATTIAFAVVAALGAFVVVALATPLHADGGFVELNPGASHSAAAGSGGLAGVAGAAALVFFAFAGYARIATLGEDVAHPARTIPRAIVLALGGVLIVYLAVAATLMHVNGPDAVARSSAPIADLVAHTAVPRAFVVGFAALAAFGSLVALMAGVGRTAMAMARNGDLPRGLAAQGSAGAPWRAEAASGALALVLVLIGDLGLAIAISSFSVLTYYAIANVSAARALSADRVAYLRLWPGVSMVGAVLCVLLAFALPLVAVVGGLALLTIAVLARAAIRRDTVYP